MARFAPLLLAGLALALTAWLFWTAEDPVPASGIDEEAATSRPRRTKRPEPLSSAPPAREPDDVPDRPEPAPSEADDEPEDEPKKKTRADRLAEALGVTAAERKRGAGGQG